MSGQSGRGGVLAPSTILQDRYRILRLHDRGGSATVYLAERLGVEERVPLAVKELNPDAFSLAEFKNEVNVLYSLNHPNLPKVYDFFEQDGKHYLVMDFVRGRTLKDIVLESGPLPEEQVLDYALQVSDIMSYLHGRAERKIIHRDLKPSNLMLTRSGQVKLLDFGIARVPDSRLPGNELHAYTEDYASPEQKANLETDERSDIYSFGVTLRFLLTGELPYPGDGPAALDSTGTGGLAPDATAPIPGASAGTGRGAAAGAAAGAAGIGAAGTGTAAVETGAVAPAGFRLGRDSGHSRELRRIVNRCLCARPRDRYQSFEELAEAIQAYRQAKRTRLTRFLWTAAAAVALVALVFVGKLIFMPSLYPVAGPDRIVAGSEEAYQVGLPAAWDGSLQSIVWEVIDTQAPGQPVQTQRGRYLSFGTTDLGVFQIQAYEERDGSRRPLSEVKEIRIYPHLDVPGELLSGQPVVLRCSGVTASGGREYRWVWDVRGPFEGDGEGQAAEDAPVALHTVTTEPRCEHRGFAETGRYLVQVSVDVRAPGGIEVTVAGDPREVTVVDEIEVDPLKIVNRNTGFEQQYENSPLHWVLVYPEHVVYDSAGGRAGPYALRFPSWSGVPSSYAVQLVPLDPGRSYRLTAWMRGEGVTEGSRITVQARFRSSVDETYVLPSRSLRRGRSILRST